MRRDPYRRYRRQMRRGYRTRHGGYPIILPPAYEPVAAVAFAAAGRLAYRHRSAFLPFAVSGLVFIAALVLHRHHPGAWPVAAAVTAAATFVLGMPHRVMWSGKPGPMKPGLVTRAWEACGIDRPAERVYAASIVATAGGWLTAAMATGPTMRPLPAIAVIATVVLGIPWWAHRRRGARVRIERTVQAWPDLAENMGLPGSRMASATGDVWGFTARIILRKGTTSAQAVNQISAIESGLGIRPGSVRALPDQHRADRLILRVVETDPHAQPIPWPGQPDTSIARPAELGQFEDGQPVRLTILRRNVLLGGTTGAGKSGVLNVILAFLAACADVIIWGVDLKGGMELQPWAGCLARIATTPEEASQIFADAIRELNQRAALMTAQSRRVWEPSPGMPALIIVVDEYAEMPPEAQEYADSVARRGRAVAVNLIAATQRPTQEAMGNNAVRSQMDVRVCLRVRERRDVDLILGQGSFNAGWHANSLTQPGTFLLSAPEHVMPERARAYLINDDQVTRHADRHARAAAPMATSAPQEPAEGEPRPQSGGTVVRTADSPEGALWLALCRAPEHGQPIRALMAASGMGRSWVYARLREHAEAGRVVQASHGCWRAVPAPDSHAE